MTDPKGKQRWKHTLDELYRVRWMVAVAVAVILARGLDLVPETSPLLLVAYKLSIVALAFVAAHVAWSQCFFYLDTQGLLGRALGEDMVAAVCFGATIVARAIFYGAFVLGVALGL